MQKPVEERRTDGSAVVAATRPNVGLMEPNVAAKKAMEIVPDGVRGYLRMPREEFNFGYYVNQLFNVQREIGRTLDAENEAGILLEARFHTKPRELMPGPKGLEFVRVSEAEDELFNDRTGSRQAAACMGVDASLEMWHTQGNGGDAFSGGHGRMPPSAKLDIEHLPMMARMFGFTGVAFHTWLDVHPDDMRNLSLNLLARDQKINSAFHGAFHGPIFARGAMSSEFKEVRHLAKLLKQEGQLYSMLGWDPATAIEEQLKGLLGQEKTDEIRQKNVVVDALKDVSAGKKSLDAALTTALGAVGVENAGTFINKMLKAVVEKPGCAEVCDWDGTDGQMLMESHAKSASLLGLEGVRPSLSEFLRGEVTVDGDRKVTRMDLLIDEKVERILMTGGKIKIKIEPKFQDPSEMTEADIQAVLEVKKGVETKIKDYLGAQIISNSPSITAVDYQRELAERFKPYDGCITCQIEEGHSRQMPMRLASADVERAIQGGALAGAYHMNYSPSGSGLGDPDHTALVDNEMVRLMYVLAKDRRIGPNADPTKKVTMEFDMAPHFWDLVEGWQASRESVNVGVGIAMNLLKVEEAMRARGKLALEQEEIQRGLGTLRPDEGIFDMLDTGRISNAIARAHSMPIDGLQHIPAHEDAQKFRQLVGRPYDIALPTEELASRPDVEAKLRSVGARAA